MITDETDPLPVMESWDTYWQGAQASAAYTGGGTSHPLILTFWHDYFGKLRERRDDLKIIDVASGNGAVVECAHSVFGAQLPAFACLDVSASAIRMLEQRFPGVRGVVADAAAIPLESASYDVVTSQFGIEYAGLDALEEVARLIADGGELALLLHHRGGRIYQQCDASLDAISQMKAASFIQNCTAMFEAGFAVLKNGDRDRYSAAGKKFAPAVRAMESIMMQHGRDVADGTILRIYRDVRQIHQTLRRYEQADVLDWLSKMDSEINAYAGRMASMRQVAIDNATFASICSGLVEHGFDILRGEPLAAADQELPMAWTLVAKKP